MEYTIEEVKNAYNKLRAYIYYDSGELLLREKIVIFETDLSNDPNDFLKPFYNNDYSRYVKDENGEINSINNYFSSVKIDVDKKLEIITDRLNNYHNEPEFFIKYINEIGIKIFPKIFSSEKKENEIVSNKRVKEKYSLEKITAFIDAPIEIHILSVLWILRQGVNIDSKLPPECVGNRLLLNKNKDKVIQGSALFKPYFKQYQKWRDGAVFVANELLEKDKNALFLNLDIKDYYYSVRLDKKTFPYDRNNEFLNAYDNLNEILLDVHLNYTSKVLNEFEIPYDFSDEIKDENGNIDKFILPIGLLSSYVLANNYLSEFDKVIIEKFKPAYYGRYVDDILLVLSEPNPLSFKDTNIFSDFTFSFEKYLSKVNDNKSKFYNISFKEEHLSDVELYILNNLSEIVSLVDNPFYKKENDIKSICSDIKERIFKVNGYPSLFFQSEKTLLHYFDKDESSIVIDKLKKELREKSSEFRDLPNEKDDSNNFEESAYYLQYDGSDGKIKTLKDYKEDRFGLSVYLSHKIGFALRNQKIISEKEQNKIIKFFKGENCITLYKLWEKILTLFLINNQPKNYVDFLFHCIEQIDKIKEGKKYSEKINSNVRDTLVNYLFCAHEVSLSLNLNFLSLDKKISREYEFKSAEFKSNSYTMFFSSLDFIKPSSFIATRYRQANMIRHHYVIVPLLNFTEESKKGKINLVDRELHIDQFKLDERLLENSPRPIKFWECCIASSLHQLNDFSNKKNLVLNSDGYIETDILYNIEQVVEKQILNIEKQEYENKQEIIQKNYLDLAFEYFMIGNKSHSNDYQDIKEIKSHFYNEHGDKFEIDKSNKIEKPKISFANTEILDDNILKSILGNPNLTEQRYNQLADILKKSREENTDILLFPECFIPFNLLSTLSRYSTDNQSLIISGLEHITVNNTSFNFVVSIIPVEVNGIKDATVLLRLKNNYSPNEEHLINKNHLNVPKPAKEKIQIINWRNIYFSVCYCFEMANISHRERLKSKIDLLIGIEWNKDIPYFSNIVESSSRDLHCYVAQVNTSNFGDTRLTQPKESAVKDILRLKGGLNDVILIGEIDIKSLRNFQRIKSSINTSKEFKPIPPDFSLEEIMKRIHNQ